MNGKPGQEKDADETHLKSLYFSEGEIREAEGSGSHFQPATTYTFSVSALFVLPCGSTAESRSGAALTRSEGSQPHLPTSIP